MIGKRSFPSRDNEPLQNLEVKHRKIDHDSTEPATIPARLQKIVLHGKNGPRVDLSACNSTLITPLIDYINAAQLPALTVDPGTRLYLFSLLLHWCPDVKGMTLRGDEPLAGLDDSWIQQIFNQDCTLQRLSLSDIAVDPECFSVLTEHIVRTLKLASLEIAYDYLDEDLDDDRIWIKKIGAALGSEQCVSTLRHLSIDSPNLDEKSVAELVKGMRNNTGLTSLLLRCDSDDALMPLLDALADEQGVGQLTDVAIEISDGDLTPRSKKYSDGLARAISTNRKLKSLTVDSALLARDARDDIIKAVECSLSLTSFATFNPDDCIPAEIEAVLARNLRSSTDMAICLAASSY